jgi:ribosome maturation factor RimP
MKFSRFLLKKIPNIHWFRKRCFVFRHSLYYFCTVFESFWRGQQSPLSLSQPMSVLKQTVLELVEKHLPDESHFVVEVKLEEKAGKQRLLILIDADQGVTIDTCAKVSRRVSEDLEALDLVGEAYVLEVSSPGLDYPLSTLRQYHKNLGRDLKVTLSSGSDLQGNLKEIGETFLKMTVKKKEKGKKATEEEIAVPFEDVKKAIVQVSFK